MSTRDFFFWLKGYFDAGAADLSLIADKMALVKPDDDCGCGKNKLQAAPAIAAAVRTLQGNVPPPTVVQK